MALFLTPASSNNAFISLGRPIEKEQLRRALDNERQFQEVLEAAGRNAIYCWAMRDAKSSVFMKLKPGDEVAFAVKGTGKFNFVGTVFCTLQSNRFATRMWDPELTDWRLIYFLKDVKNISVDKTEFLVALGYDKTDRLQGARPVVQDRVAPIIKKHGSIRAYLEKLDTEAHLR